MKLIAQNKRARRELEILERLEAGIVLVGTEVKSVRAGKVQLVDAHVVIKNREAWLLKMNIAEYEKGSWTNHEPTRKRKLLLHRQEIRRLKSKIDERGLTLVPLRVYLNARGKVKVEVGLGRGKKFHDRREDIKKRDAERAIRREMRARG